MRERDSAAHDILKVTSIHFQQIGVSATQLLNVSCHTYKKIGRLKERRDSYRRNRRKRCHMLVASCCNPSRKDESTLLDIKWVANALVTLWC